MALSSRVQNATESTPEIPNNEVFDTYHHICEQEGSDPLKERRLRDILSEQEFLSIVEQERRGRGRGKGRYNVNRLVDDPELVIKACREAGED